MSEVIYEIANEQDIPAAVCVHEAAFYEWDGAKDREKVAASWRESLRKRPDCILSIARLDGEVVAFTIGWADKEPGNYFIALVGGKPETRGRGIGRGLFRFTIEEIRKRDYKTIDINTLNRYRAMLILCVTEDFDIVDLKYDEGRKCKRIFLRRTFGEHVRP
jgi:predicted N-acetyltransferase YhbS